MSQQKIIPNVGSELTVTVTKVTFGKDNKVYITIKHSQAENHPTLIWRS